jgi:hypothetical protein
MIDNECIIFKCNNSDKMLCIKLDYHQTMMHCLLSENVKVSNVQHEIHSIMYEKIKHDMTLTDKIDF